MRVLVLGATGYVGSRLVPHLLEHGHEVVAASSSAPDPERFLRDAAAFGWPVEAGPDLVLAALRLRFRPAAQGPLSPADMAVAADLARRFPVDGVAVSA